MITRVKVKNFRNLADVDVELGPMTVLVGRNGADKSTFLDVLRFVRDALRVGLDTAIDMRSGIRSIRRWLHQGRPYDIEVSVEFETSDATGAYSFTLASSRNDAYRVKREHCAIQFEGRSAMQYEIKEGKWSIPPTDWFMDAKTGSNINVETTALALPTVAYFITDYAGIERYLTNTGFYALFPDSLRAPQTPSNEAVFSDHGKNMATVLRQIKRKGQNFSDLLAALESVTSDIDDIRVTQAGGYLITELKHGQKNNRSAWFPLAQISDGTLRMLGLLVALYQDATRNLIAIEEPELAIHPGALAVLSDVLHEASQRTQVLITTQSPDLISRFKAEQLRIVERVNGVTEIGPIDEIQREAINDQLFSAGDLLRIEGLHLAPTAEAA